MKPIKYPKKDRVKGIYAYCQKCNTCIGTGTCQKSKKRLSSCQFPEFHTFRASVIVPNTNSRKRKKRILNTTNLLEAKRLKKEFEEELKINNYEIPVEEVIATEIIEITPEVIEVYVPEKNNLLINYMDQYIRFLNNEGVEAHKVKVRTKKHVDDVKRYFRYFCLALKGKDIDHTKFEVTALNDQIVGYIHSYLLNDLGYKNKTYNKAMSQFRQFIKWLIDDKGISMANPFKGVNKKTEKKDDTTISKEELQLLLDTITPENSINIAPSGYRRNYYKDWMKTAILIALETGLRREEFTTLKFSDIQADKNGNPYCIKVENFKVNRIKGNVEEDEKDIKTIPITLRMNEILTDLHFKKYINNDRYLVAPDENVTRETIGEFVSKAFTHFWNLSSKRKVNLKHLRKTYLTALVNHFGDKATIISDHADIEILKKHYTNNEVIMKANQGFKVFS